MSEIDRLQRQIQRSADELRVAEIIQRSLLPESLPDFAGWQLDAFYQPARTIGGDLYDFIQLPGDLLGIVLGDASDKGIPAALVMATTRALIRAAAVRLVLPGLVLAHVNDDLAAQIPPGVFVTCFYAILDTSTGRLRYANAGQCAPVLHSPESSEVLDIGGWPLGMLPGKTYQEGNLHLLPGQSILCFSDGIIESHDHHGQMFGTVGVMNVVANQSDGSQLLGDLLRSQRSFSADSDEPEDDLTVISIHRMTPAEIAHPSVHHHARLSIPSLPETERVAADRILAEIAHVPLGVRQRERLHTAIAESFMNAAEYGNQFRSDLDVEIEILATDDSVTIRISDHGLCGPLPEQSEPDLNAKLAGEQSPRGWGLLLIREMVDSSELIQTDSGLTVSLTVNLDQSREHIHV
jgi:anti-sigma regulatory factor (Ser/Thr protein kinase)